MMKRIISILAMVVLAMTMAAQSYSALWKQERTAEEKDMSKSALNAIWQIEKKAEREGNYGNLLAALTRELSMQQEISPDSLASCRKRLADKQARWRLSSHGVEATLADVALGNCKITNKRKGDKRGDMECYVDSLLSSPDSATYTRQGLALGYAPFVEKGIDSQYFNNDLLSLIILSKWMEYGNSMNDDTINLLEKHYGKSNKMVTWFRTRQEIAAENGINTGRRKIRPVPYRNADDTDYTHKLALIDKAIAEWKGWKEVNELINERNTLTNPTYNVSIPNHTVNTRQEVKIYFSSVRNVHNVRVTLKNDRGETRTVNKDFDIRNECNFTQDSLTISGLSLGKWDVTFYCHETDKTIRNNDKATIYVTNLKVIRQALPDGRTLFIVVDAITGEAVPLAKVFIKPDEENAVAKEYTADANGEVTAGKGDSYRHLVRCAKGADSTMPFESAYTGYYYSESPKIIHNVNIYTDRAIYRCGQTVHANALCFSTIDGKETLPQVKDTVTFTLSDRTGKEIGCSTTVTDEYGTATTDFTIPAEGMNGRYYLYAKAHGRAQATISVEDYKRPSFSITLTKPDVAYHIGDTVCVKGVAKTYSGVPVANARVISNVRRISRWFWCRTTDGITPTDYAHSDTLLTDADGTFQIRMPMTIPENVDTAWFYCYNIKADVTVTDNAGESHSQSLSLPLKNDAPKMQPEKKEAPALSVSADTFPAKPGEKVTVTLRPRSKDITAYYTLCSGNRLLEKGRLEFSDSTTYDMTYREEYGDGVTFSVAWVKNGEFFSGQESVKKFLPSKKLTVEWASFRNKLAPGKKETWTLQVRDNEGKPAVAQLMAVLYDKSLDAIKKHGWDFSDTRRLSLPSTWWRTSEPRSQYLYFGKTQKWLQTSSLEFNHIGMQYHFFQNSIFDFGTPLRGGIIIAKPMLAMAKESLGTSAMTKIEMATDRINTADRTAPTKDCEQETVSGTGGEETVLRSDFAETAFFMPSIQSDRNGVASLIFTMPESVTQWKFMAIAHDREMRCGTLVDEAITQKQLMVQPNIPRFLRKGDKAIISVNVANLTDRRQKATVTLTVLDAASESVLHTESKTVSITAGQAATVPFNLTADGNDVICRFTARITGFSDGEQHLLPVIEEKELEVDTASFTVNPRELMMKALPAMQTPKSQNAICLANAIYANTLAASIDSTRTAEYRNATRNLIYQLILLQRPDGGFAWYGGMESNHYITIAVLKTLARMEQKCGQQENVATMMGKAFTYARKEMEKEMRYMTEHKYWYLSGDALDWLYTLAITDTDGGTAEKWFRKLIYSQTKDDDMQTKAVAAITMAGNGMKGKSREFVESIKQHTVYRKDMGRYFDSYRAEYSWCDYRIPTHIMCIEAMNEVTPEDGQTITEMLRWLVQAKRTQRWDNAINAANAIYAFQNAKDTMVKAAFTVCPTQLRGALKIRREVISINGGHESSSGNGEEFKAGCKVKVRLTIDADRDYDFVTVTDNRAACMEPVSQTSSNRWGYYEELRDSQTLYHFDQMSKGRHTVETEYYIDRTGSYQQGNATAICEYAPEFCAETEGKTITVK